MARTCRDTGPGCIHHAVNRGNRKADIFLSRRDYAQFMGVLEQAVARHRMRLLAFCAMPNHWHMVLWPDNELALSAFMHWLTSTHVRRYHIRHGLTGTGHLYQDRFRNDVCTDLRRMFAMIRYVEANPLAAGLVRRAEHWRWSSLYLRAHGDDSGLLSPGPIALPENWIEYVNESTPVEHGSETQRRKQSRRRASSVRSDRFLSARSFPI